jgi:hypothetical protein
MKTPPENKSIDVFQLVAEAGKELHNNPFWATRGKSIHGYAQLEQSLCQVYCEASGTNKRRAYAVFFKPMTAPDRAKMILTDIPRILGSRGAMVCLLRPRGNAFRQQSHVISSRSDVFPSGEREIGWFCFHQDAAFLLSSITFDSCAAHAGAGGARNRAISDRISANSRRGTATSASWNVTYRP